VDIPETLPPMQGDNDAIKQVALHLLQNACDVTPENGQVKLKANMESYGEDEDYVLVNVVDSGPGIQSDDIPRVFTQTMQANEQSIQGTGHAPVGLAISKTLVEAHGGRIWVESKAGDGATFSVLLPLIQSTTPAGGHWS
jgi:two-component system sensor histidine kinase BaeS